MFTIMALLFVSLQIFAQETTINGTVLSGTDNEPLIGVTVREKGSKNATITDLDGNFNLKVSNARVMLEFSYVGFTTKSLVAAPSMKVVLSENAQSLNELVVVGYQSQRKADLTGAVAVVSTESLKTTPDTDPMRALQGRVAGMTVTTDGSPAGTGTVRIRGIGSINSSQDPLYIVDGVPTTRALNSLNMNDIESMQVLKDAASASIYGSRAANGVIIITTRHGQKNDKVDINFSANITAQYYSSQSKMKLSNSAEYATEMAQAALNDGLDPVAYAQNYGLNLNSTGGTPITVYNPATGKYSNYTVGGYYDGYINRKKTILYSDTNWLDAISQTGIMQNYDLSISHATDKSSVMFSLGYKNNEGILKYTNFDNISARINSTFQLTKEIKIGENVTISHSNQVASSPMENALKMSPTVPLYEEDGTTFSGPVGGMSDRQNPLRELYQNRDNNLETWRIFGNAFVELTPIKGLTLKSNFGLDYATGFHNYRTFTYYSDIVSNNIPKTDTGQSNDCVWTWSNTANYNFTLAKDHNFTVLLGTEAVKAIGQSFSAYAESYALETNDYMWPDASTGVQKAYGSQGSNTLFSLFGKIDYNWKDMLLASATIRRDGSSRFGKNHRYGTFPAAKIG
ncbi:MAG: SusC/RagA family TonB-linked outer membrane protein, partial [Prevotella sp.]|nr:SusC/RagA family TonB-linked outer membrane protein [Prevotella sp.]